MGPTNITKAKIEDGRVGPQTLVWTAGQADWLPAEQTELRALFEGAVQPPPLPGEQLLAETEEELMAGDVEESEGSGSDA